MADEGQEDEGLEDADFNVYYRVAKNHAFKQLSNLTDSSKACAWLLKIKDCQDKKLKLDYIRLLVFALYMKRMIGPFETRPPEEDLEPFPEGIDVLTIGRTIIRQVEEERAAQRKAAEVVATLSWDRREFAAHQTTKGMAQCFYALSPNPIDEWIGYKQEDDDEIVSHLGPDFDMYLALDELAKCRPDGDQEDDGTTRSNDSTSSESDTGEGDKVEPREPSKGRVIEDEKSEANASGAGPTTSTSHRSQRTPQTPEAKREEKWFSNAEKLGSILETKTVPDDIETPAGVLNESNRIMNLYSGCIPNDNDDLDGFDGMPVNAWGAVSQYEVRGSCGTPAQERSFRQVVDRRATSTPLPTRKSQRRRPTSPDFQASPIESPCVSGCQGPEYDYSSSMDYEYSVQRLSDAEKLGKLEHSMVFHNEPKVMTPKPYSEEETSQEGVIYRFPERLPVPTLTPTIYVHAATPHPMATPSAGTCPRTVGRQSMDYSSATPTLSPWNSFGGNYEPPPMQYEPQSAEAPSSEFYSSGQQESGNYLSPPSRTRRKSPRRKSLPTGGARTPRDPVTQHSLPHGRYQSRPSAIYPSIELKPVDTSVWKMLLDKSIDEKLEDSWLSPAEAQDRPQEPSYCTSPDDFPRPPATSTPVKDRKRESRRSLSYSVSPVVSPPNVARNLMAGGYFDSSGEQEPTSSDRSNRMNEQYLEESAYVQGGVMLPKSRRAELPKMEEIPEEQPAPRLLQTSGRRYSSPYQRSPMTPTVGFMRTSYATRQSLGNVPSSRYGQRQVASTCDREIQEEV